MASKKQRKGNETPSVARRRERRFLPQALRTPLGPVLIGMAGAFSAGVGVHAQWLSDPTPEWAKIPFFAGLVAFGVGLWLSDREVLPMRVGDAGLAVEKQKDVERLAWCDIQRLYLDGATLVASGKGPTIRIPLASHPKLAAWTLKEATLRVPEVLDVSGKIMDSLPEPKESDGEVLVVEGVQVTGRECAASGEAIQVEKDARFCANCGETYLASHVPATCVTCKKPLGKRALAA